MAITKSTSNEVIEIVGEYKLIGVTLDLRGPTSSKSGGSLVSPTSIK